MATNTLDALRTYTPFAPAHRTYTPFALARKDDDGEGRWVTIGAEPGEDGKNHGGTRVFIKGKGASATIAKGPAKMVGNPPSDPVKGDGHGKGEKSAAPKGDTDAIPAGAKVKVSGGEYSYVGKNADGTHKVKGESGEFDTDPGEDVQHIGAAPKPVQKQAIKPLAEHVSAHVNAVGDARASAFNAAKAKVAAFMKARGGTLPVGISAEQAFQTLDRRQLGPEGRTLAAEYNRLKANAAMQDEPTERAHAKRVHAALVQAAVAKGESVPAEVLKDYPDLAAKAGKSDASPAQSRYERAAADVAARKEAVKAATRKPLASDAFPSDDELRAQGKLGGTGKSVVAETPKGDASKPGPEAKADAPKSKAAAVPIHEAVSHAIDHLAFEKHSSTGIVPQKDIAEHLAKVRPGTTPEEVEAALVDAWKSGKHDISESSGHIGPAGALYVKAKVPTSAPQHPVLSSKGNVPDAKTLKKSVSEVANDLRKKHGDLVPIHAVRDEIAKRHGEDAASHGALDEHMFGIEGAKLMSVSDKRAFTDDQYAAGIKHGNETKMYVDFSGGEQAKTKPAEAKPSRKTPDLGTGEAGTAEAVSRVNTMRADRGLGPVTPVDNSDAKPEIHYAPQMGKRKQADTTPKAPVPTHLKAAADAGDHNAIYAAMTEAIKPANQDKLEGTLAAAAAMPLEKVHELAAKLGIAGKPSKKEALRQIRDAVENQAEAASRVQTMRGDRLSLSRTYTPSLRTYTPARRSLTTLTALCLSRTADEPIAFTNPASEVKESPALGDNRPKEVNGIPARYFWKRILRPGTIHHPNPRIGTVHLSREDVATIDRNTRDWIKEGGRPHIPMFKHRGEGHADGFTEKTNAGWIIETKVEADGSLWGLHQFLGDDAVTEASRHQTSVNVVPNFKSGSSGKVYPMLLESNALVANPVIEGLGEWVPAA